MTHGYNTPGLLCQPENITAFLLRRRNRLFKQYVITHFQSLHARAIMQLVRCTDDHCIGKLWFLKYIFPCIETVGSSNLMLLCISLIADRYWFRYTYDV